ncbi:MAG: FecR family protein [Steroidobacteraceae bacterium]
MSRDRTPVAPQIIDEAAQWFVSMREPSASKENCAAFTDWLRTSPVHVRVYLEIAKLWGDSARIGPEFSADVIADRARNVVPLKQGSDLPHLTISDSQSLVMAAQRESSAPSEDGGARLGLGAMVLSRRFAIAASLLTVFLAGGSAWWHLTFARTYVTDVGEQRMITLEDGSIVKLNSRSRFAVRMSARKRQVDILVGEALFQVAHDTVRPFIVKSGAITIRAVGTQFDVNRTRFATVVTVVEGRVQVRAPLPPGPSVQPPSAQGVGSSGVKDSNLEPSAAAILLSAGEQASVDMRGTLARSPKANVAAATSWLQQELIFEGESLSTVIEEFNRYSRTPIVLSDPSLANMRINAVFHTTSPESLLRFVTRLDGIAVERSEGEIRIYRKP